MSNEERIEKLEKEVSQLRAKVQEMNRSHEETRKLIKFLMQSNKKELPKTLSKDVVKVVKPLGLSFDVDSIYFTVKDKKIKTCSTEWVSLASEEKFEVGKKYIFVVSILLTQNSGIMLGFHKDTENFEDLEYIGKTGWAFHGLNGKKVKDNIFNDFLPDFNGIERDDTLIIELENYEENSVIALTINKGERKVMYKEKSFGDVRFALSMNGSNEIEFTKCVMEV